MTNKEYAWKFKPVGGTTRVSIESGEDIKHLPELDQKLWTVLSCPTGGLEFDSYTLKALDTDGDGKVRVDEVRAAAAWVTKVLRNPDLLLEQSDSLPLDQIDTEDEDGKVLYESAKQILLNLGKEGDSISLADTSDSIAIFSSTKFNGDGVITPASASTEEQKAVIESIIATIGSVQDRSGVAGIDAEKVEAFYAACADYEAWVEAGKAEGVLPFGDATAAALSAVESVKEKVADYFMRCKLSAFAKDSASSLDVSAAKIAEISDKDLAACTDEISSYPVAKVNAEGLLPLDAVNPVWQDAFSALKGSVIPADKKTLSEAEWKEITGKFSQYIAWNASKKGAEVESLGIEVVSSINKAGLKAEIIALIDEDKALEAEANNIEGVNKLLHYYRYFYQFLRNYVTLDDFYKKDVPAIFQAGTLFIDQRSCNLCIKVTDMSKHGDVAALSGMYLLYCTCTSKTLGTRFDIVAALTDGDVNNLRAGMNALFYDCYGNDYDAVVTKIVDNPISIRQAFWAPYRKLANFVTEKLTKNIEDKNNKVTSDLTSKADSISIPTEKPADGAAAPAAPAMPFDIAKFAGIFAAIGMAIGYISSALVSLAKGVTAQWYNLPLLILALVVLVSGPSMALAWIKLRKRNLSPVLNANGWAINAHVLINIAFGATLTSLAKFPALELIDPVERAKKRSARGRRWFFIIFALLLIGAGVYTYFHFFA